MFSSSLLILGLIYDSICPIDGRFAYLNDIYNSHSLAQSRERWKSGRAVESSHMQNIHLIPTKRFVLSEDNDVTNMHCFSNVIWFCEDALQYSRCSFLGCLLVCYHRLSIFSGRDDGRTTSSKCSEQLLQCPFHELRLSQRR